MERLGISHDAREDFDHSLLAEGHLLRRHVLYRLRRLGWTGQVDAAMKSASFAALALLTRFPIPAASLPFGFGKIALEREWEGARTEAIEIFLIVGRKVKGRFAQGERGVLPPRRP
jgi:hypothetical protein